MLVPEGVPVGERVSFEGFEGPPEAVLNPKKKLWEKIAVDLKTNTGEIACMHCVKSAGTKCM